MRVVIVGGGVVGRVLCLFLLNRLPDLAIDLYDDGNGCSPFAGGMVAPCAEFASLRHEELLIRGRESLALWPMLAEQIGFPEVFKQLGTLLIAHQRDQNDLEFMERSCEGQSGIERISKSNLKRLEPELSCDSLASLALYFGEEGVVMVPEFLRATDRYFLNHPSVRRFSAAVALSDIRGGDCIFDVRGLGGDGVYAVRGEALVVEAPEVVLKHSIRLVHPRYPLYIAPRGRDVYYIGATSFETSDRSSVSVRSALELLGSLYFVHKGFAEARIVSLLAHCRPVSASGLPFVRVDSSIRVVTLNGFGRHGYLLSPSYCREIADSFASGSLFSSYD